MKTLKLDHEFATAVLRGDKSSTWRMYDDKDLRVNDEVELVDKVDPGRPESWVIVGVARIDKIVEKRLGDVSKLDFHGHDTYNSREAMLKNYQKHYGPQVTFETPVKMVHFTLTKADKAMHDSLPRLKEAKLYADGGSRGNPGPSASGFAIMDMNDQIVIKQGVYLGVTTNNQAEYQALKLGLEEARRMGIGEVYVYMDSLLVINQMRGIFKVKNRDLWPIHESIKAVAATFRRVTYTHVPRELNKIADREVNEALDVAAARQ